MYHNNNRGASIAPHDVFLPKHAILHYQNENIDYVEVRDVREDGTLAEARPFSVQEAISFGSSLLNRHTKVSVGVIPRNLLFLMFDSGDFHITWWTPPQLRKLHFKSNLHIPSGKLYPVPGMIWDFNKRTLSLYAIKEAPLENGNTELFKAPFHNIHSDASVCLGSGAKFIQAVKGTGSVSIMIQGVMDAFYKSYFTGMHDQTIDGNLNSFWKGLAEKTEFPFDKLVSAKKKLKNIYGETFNSSHIFTDDDGGIDNWEEDEEDDED